MNEEICFSNKKRNVAILAVAFFFLAAGTIHVCNSRGLFFDEAVYFVVGKVIGIQGTNWNFENWLVGSPWVYPGLIIGAVLKILQMIGYKGSELVNVSIPVVREINVLFGLGTLLLVYFTAKLLWDETTAIWSSIIFGSAGCVIFTSGFATYDTPSLFFMTVSLFLLISYERVWPKNKLWITFLSGAAYGLSFVTKYIVVTFIPSFIALLCVTAWFETKNEISIVQQEYPPITLGEKIWSFGKKVITLCGLWGIGALIVIVPYLALYWDSLKLVFLYSGGHTARYGATPTAILWEIVYFVGLAWLLAVVGFSSIKTRKLQSLILLGSSLVTPVYHLVFVDPLALFKHMMWTIMFASLLAGIAIKRMKIFSFRAFGVLTIFIVFGAYQVVTLEKFYPDPTPVNTWLQEHVKPTDCNILVDDVWSTRWALSNTFDKQEWCTTDQWWWYNSLATSQTWVDDINAGWFPYVIVERDGAFMGDYTVFNSDVVRAIERSGKYTRIKTFDSDVTWGNAIMPPMFKGTLKANTTVTTEIWERRN